MEDNNEATITEIFEKFKAEDELTYPAPKLVVEHRFEAKVWEDSSVWYWAIVLATATAGAFRSGFGVYDIALDEGFSTLISFIIAFLTVIGVEGTIVVMGFRPRSVDQSEDEIRTDKWIMWGVMGAALFIAIGAGVNWFLSNYEVDNSSVAAFVHTLDLLQRLSAAFLLPLILAGVTEVVAKQRFIALYAEDISRVKFEKTLQAWREERNTRWLRYPERLALVGEQEVQALQLLAMQRHAGVGVRDQMKERNKSLIVGAGPARRSEIPVSEQLVAIVNAYWNEYEAIPADYKHIIQLASDNGLEVSNGLASEFHKALRFLTGVEGGEPSKRVSKIMERLDAGAE